MSRKGGSAKMINERERSEKWKGEFSLLNICSTGQQVVLQFTELQKLGLLSYPMKFILSCAATIFTNQMENKLICFVLSLKIKQIKQSHFIFTQNHINYNLYNTFFIKYIILIVRIKLKRYGSLISSFCYY